MCNSNRFTASCPQRRTWTQLTKVTLIQVILFNQEGAGDGSKTLLSAYLSQSDPQEDVTAALLDLEKRDKKKKRGEEKFLFFWPSSTASIGSACQQTAGMLGSSGEHIVICKTIRFYLLPLAWLPLMLCQGLWCKKSWKSHLYKTAQANRNSSSQPQ